MGARKHTQTAEMKSYHRRNAPGLDLNSGYLICYSIIFFLGGGCLLW